MVAHGGRRGADHAVQIGDLAPQPDDRGITGGAFEVRSPIALGAYFRVRTGKVRRDFTAGLEGDRRQRRTAAFEVVVQPIGERVRRCYTRLDRVSGTT
ncbi:hypothetical protein GCM10022243_60940 [Saccharothrix violaceirubra]